MLAGFVEIREERERSDRIVVSLHRLDGLRSADAPDRVRVAVRKGTAPMVGSFVEFKAHLSPPLPPLRPGGYDFARDMYFQRIGASGYALGAIKAVALWGGREIAGLILASLVAGAATTPYAAYHFHRLAPYGVIANLLAMPVVSAWVMPMGILGVLALPFGFDAPFWQMMGGGIEWMDTVALWVTSLPGAVGRMQAFGTGPLLLGTAGMLLLCLLRTPLRWSGAVLAVAASLWAVATPRPDVLVAGDGQAAALRGPGGRLAVLSSGRDTFAIKEWLAADGDARTVKDAGLHDGVLCDAAGCIGQLSDGRLVSMALKAEAFAEDCARAAVVVSAREATGACAATLVDRKLSRANGAIALRWSGDHFEQSAARPPGYERPWAGGPHELAGSEQAPTRPVTRDATPREEDLEIGD
jgi:competence protein ComEC